MLFGPPTSAGVLALDQSNQTHLPRRHHSAPRRSSEPPPYRTATIIPAKAGVSQRVALATVTLSEPFCPTLASSWNHISIAVAAVLASRACFRMAERFF
jgi:hypothetical protein